MNLFKCGIYIIDIEECSVLNKSQSATFDFNNMTMYSKAAKSQKRPIRYDGENILHWKSQTWNKWPEHQQKAINMLFDECMDRSLLD